MRHLSPTRGARLLLLCLCMAAWGKVTFPSCSIASSPEIMEKEAVRRFLFPLGWIGKKGSFLSLRVFGRLRLVRRKVPLVLNASLLLVVTR